MRIPKKVSWSVHFFLMVLIPVFLLQAAHTLAAGPPASPKPPSGNPQTGFHQPSSPQTILQHLDKHIGRMKPSQADSWVLRLIDRQARDIEGYEKRLFSKTFNLSVNRYSPDDLRYPEKIKEPTTKAWVMEVLNEGYKFSASEGMIYIEIDYPRILSAYGRYTSPTVNGYLRIMAAETRRHFAEDAGLTITPDQLASRIVLMEHFRKDHPGFKRMADITPLYRSYRTAYFIGLNNTPAFSYQTQKLTQEFLNSYQRTLRRYPGTTLSKQVGQYLKVLERNRYLKTRQVLDFAEGMSQ